MDEGPAVRSAPRVWPVFVAFAAVVVGSFLCGVVLVIVSVATAGTPLPSDPVQQQAAIREMVAVPWFMHVSLGTSATLLAAFALIGAAASPVPFVARLRLGPASHLSGPRHVVVAAVAAVTALCVGGAVQALLLQLGATSSVLDAMGETARVADEDTSALLLTFATFALAAPLGEELFFRGFAQTRLVARLGGLRGALVASALFGALHFDPVHSTAAFAIGLVLALVTERTASIRAALFAHAANNALYVLGRQGDAEQADASTAGVLAVIAALGVALLWWLSARPAGAPAAPSQSPPPAPE